MTSLRCGPVSKSLTFCFLAATVCGCGDGQGGGSTPPGLTAPRVERVFTADGQAVVVTFTRAMSGGASHPSAYGVTGDDSSSVGVASVSLDAERATLALSSALTPGVVYTVSVSSTASDTFGLPIDEDYSSGIVRGKLHLGLVWTFSEPDYRGWKPADQGFSSPWVRRHARKTCMGLASALADHAELRWTVGLSPLLLDQVAEYVEALEPCIDSTGEAVDEARISTVLGKSDSWMDLLLTDTPSPAEANEAQRSALWEGECSCRLTPAPLAAQFPEYEALCAKDPADFTREDLLGLKILCELAWYDPAFLESPGVTLPGAGAIDLSDVVGSADGGYYLLEAPSETLARRLAAEDYKVLTNLVAAYASLGERIEFIGCPGYEPILPLIFDTDVCGGTLSNLPDPAYSQPADADAQVAIGVRVHAEHFGSSPAGMWPAEGAVSTAALDAFALNGVEWILADQASLAGAGHTAPKRAVTSGGDLAIFSRDRSLSELLSSGFAAHAPEAAAEILLRGAWDLAPAFGAPDRMLVIAPDIRLGLESDPGARDFLRALCGRLTVLQTRGEIVTVTSRQYLAGDVARGIDAHPVASLTITDPLAAATWAEGPTAEEDGSFAGWIGGENQLTAWEYLRTARADLSDSGLARPNPMAGPPTDQTALHVWAAHESIYRAEGGYWFRRYASGCGTPPTEGSFDEAFRGLLYDMYENMNNALILLGRPPVQVPTFDPIVE